MTGPVMTIPVSGKSIFPTGGALLGVVPELHAAGNNTAKTSRHCKPRRIIDMLSMRKVGYFSINIRLLRTTHIMPPLSAKRLDVGAFALRTDWCRDLDIEDLTTVIIERLDLRRSSRIPNDPLRRDWPPR